MNHLDNITANDDNSARRQYDLGYHDGRAATLRQRQKRKAPTKKKKTPAKKTTRSSGRINVAQVFIGFFAAFLILKIFGCY